MQSSASRILLPLVFLLPFLVSCLPMQKEEEQPGTDCIPIARMLAQAINSSKPDMFDGKFDYDAFAGRMMQGTPLASSERRALRDYLRQEFSVGRQLCNDVKKNGAEYTLLHMRQVDGVPRVLVRVRYENGAFTYYDLIFGYTYLETVNGEEQKDIMVRDVYIYATGEMMSKAIRPGFDNIRNRFMIEKLMNKEQDTSFSDLLRYADTLRSMREEGDFNRLRGYYNSIPGRFRKDRSLMSIYIKAAEESDTGAYLTAIDDFVKTFPQGASCQLLLIDKYALLRNYDSLIATIGRLDSLIEGDPFLRYLTGMAYLRKEDTTSSKRGLKSAIKDEPMLYEPYWPLIGLLVGERDFAGAIPYINALALWHHESVPMIEGPLVANEMIDQRYGEFLKSKDYAEWKNRRLGKSEEKKDGKKGEKKDEKNEKEKGGAKKVS